MAILEPRLEKNLKSISLDLVKEFHSHTQEKFSLKREPLFKALKLTREDEIIDATCGTGRDSMLLLAVGCKVVAYERHPQVFELLQEALKEARESDYAPFFEKFTLIFGEAKERRGEKCFFDPMYKKGRHKSSLPRKQMQQFQELVGEDEDQEEVLEDLKKSYKRVVLKRQIKAPFLSSPNYSIFGKIIRYDVYSSM